MRIPSRKLAPLLVFLCLSGAACGAGPVQPDDVTGPETWGGTEGVTRLHHLYFAGQPDLSGLRAAREKGVVAVVNLRHPDELADLGFDEGSEIEKLGMKYYSTPVASPDPFDAATLAAIEAAVHAHEDEPVLVHCGSSNRVGAWLAIHLVQKHGMPVEAALEVGERAGLRREKLEGAVREALARDQAGR